MAQIPDFPIGGAPPIPNAEAPVPNNSASRFFDLVTDTANEYTKAFEEQRGTLEGTQSDGTPKTGFEAITSYGQAYNKTAGAIYSINKTNQIDTAINQAYVDNKDNPAGLRDAIEKVKGTTLSDVPPLYYPEMLKKFGEKSTSAGINAQNNFDANLHQEATATVINQISANSRIMASKISILGPDAAINDPDYVQAQTDNATLYQQAKDTTHIGGPLIAPEQFNDLINKGKYQVRESEIKYQYSQTPMDQRDGFIENLALHGDKDLPAPQLYEVEKQLRIAHAAEKQNARQDAGLYVKDMQDAAVNLKNNDPITANFDIAGAVLKGAQYGLSKAELLTVHRELTTAKSIGEQNALVDKMPLADQEAYLDKLKTNITTTPPATAEIPQSASLSYANNNPGNLKFVGQQGASLGSGGYASFETPEAGLAALHNQVKLDAGRDLNVRDFVTKYAPPSENDTELYIKQLNASLKTNDNTKISSIPEDDLVKFIAKKESGSTVVGDVTAQADNYRILKEVETHIQKNKTELLGNPIKFGIEHNIVPGGLDMNQPNSITARAEGVRKLNASYGINSGLFSNEEANSFTHAYGAMASDGKKQLIDNLNNANLQPNEMSATLRQLDKENPSLPLLAQMMTKDNPLRATAIKALDGEDVLKNNPETIDKDGTVKRRTAELLGSMLPIDPSGQMTQAYTRILRGTYASDALKSGQIEVDANTAKDQAETNFAKFFGYQDYGSMPQINGHAIVPFKTGSSNREHNALWKSINDDDLKALSGGSQPVDQVGTHANAISAADIHSRGYPVPSGVSGLYNIVLSGAHGDLEVARDTTGKPIVWNPTAQPSRVSSSFFPYTFNRIVGSPTTSPTGYQGEQSP